MNIFLVEDEHWALAELVELLKVYEPDHTIYPFNNGDDALEAAHKTSPCLVITDITMPGINGLELIHELKQLDSATKYILLTVHDEFKYAQQGLKMGVKDYLLKPIKKEELYQTIDQTIRTIENTNRQRKRLSSLAIKELLFKPHGYHEDSSNAINEQDYCVVYFLAENFQSEKGWAHAGITNKQLLSYFFDKHMKDDLYIVDIDNQRKVMLIPLSDQLEMTTIEADLRQIYQKLRKEINVHISYLLMKKSEKLNETYETLEKQLVEKMTFGSSSLISPNVVEDDINLEDTWVKIRMIRSFIEKGELIKAYDMVDKIVRELKEKKITFRQLNLLIINMYYALTYSLQEKKSVDFNSEKVENSFDDLQQISTYSQLTEYLVQMINNFSKIYTPDVVAPKKLIPRIVEWIHNNYHEQITFQKFADENYVSLSYLSREFKKQIGYSFSDYLAEYRVKKAKSFISEGIKQTSEVCQLVGYEDPKYFSNVFKKVTGVTPTQYMNMEKGEKVN